MATPDEIDRLYREGVAAIRAGDKATGKEKLMKVVEAEQLHEQAWLWLSACVDARDEQIVCLQNVLTVNPQNEAARRGLEKLGVARAEDNVASELASPLSKDMVQPALSPASELPADEQWRARFLDPSATGEGFVSDAILIPDRPSHHLEACSICSAPGQMRCSSGPAANTVRRCSTAPCRIFWSILSRLCYCR